ncbi:MAG: hypothetical protein IPF58_16565 [Saprospirales bacterium]|nr:hypothetical protein [Saprospirales bacterium]
MANVIQIRNLPNPAALYARIASTLLKKGKGNLPDIKIQYDNQIIQPSDLKKYNKVCGFEHTLIVPSTFIHTRAFELQALLLTHPACPFPYPKKVGACTKRLVLNMRKHQAISIQFIYILYQQNYLDFQNI